MLYLSTEGLTFDGVADEFVDSVQTASPYGPGVAAADCIQEALSECAQLFGADGAGVLGAHHRDDEVWQRNLPSLQHDRHCQRGVQVTATSKTSKKLPKRSRNIQNIRETFKTSKKQ